MCAPARAYANPNAHDFKRTHRLCSTGCTRFYSVPRVIELCEAGALARTSECVRSSLRLGVHYSVSAECLGIVVVLRH